MILHNMKKNFKVSHVHHIRTQPVIINATVSTIAENLSQPQEDEVARTQQISRETPGKPQGNHRESPGKPQGNHRETTGKPQGIPTESPGKPQGISRETTGNLQGNHRETTGKPQGIQTNHVQSVVPSHPSL